MIFLFLFLSIGVSPDTLLFDNQYETLVLVNPSDTMLEYEIDAKDYLSKYHHGLIKDEKIYLNISLNRSVDINDTISINFRKPGSNIGGAVRVGIIHTSESGFSLIPVYIGIGVLLLLVFGLFQLLS